MQDFVRIRGEIISNPLNENFRRLINEISRANTNLIFPEEDAIVSTITDMMNIHDPEDAQSCYVISSGEFYRYSRGDNQWHKIMDIGQTFRQGFLNSGVVVVEGAIQHAGNAKLTIPNMLVYFKNQEGDGRYLRGMYLITGKTQDFSSKISTAGSYSIFVNSKNEFNIVEGMPMTDDPDNVFLGTFLVNNKLEILSDCVYTLPDIAYTADRGNFLLSGGQVTGLSFVEENSSTLTRKSGYYYDEGINYTVGQTRDFPADTDNGSNYNLKYFEAQSPASLIYLIPDKPLNHDFTAASKIINNKYWKDGALADVEEGYYTIQKHLITPTGQNFILYGDTKYNSVEDATANLNVTKNVELDFPFVEVTRIVVKGGSAPDLTDRSHIVFYTLERLAQAGTVNPEFDDDVFMIYSSQDDDNTPARIKVSLDLLQQQNYSDTFTLTVGENETTRHNFGLDKKYINDNTIQNIIKTTKEERTGNGKSGYILADNTDVELLEERVSSIEKEIWDILDSTKSNLYDQSIRYRLFNAEGRIKTNEDNIKTHNTRITNVENNKVNKTTKVNGYTLGDTSSSTEAKAVVLKTGDIAEAKGLGSTTNLWYTEARVSANTDVKNATTHIGRKGTGTESNANPHAMSTDNITQLTNSDKRFVTKAQENKINNLPADTSAALDEKIEGVNIYKVGDSELLGCVTDIRFYDDGVNLSVDEDTKSLYVECVGQVNDSYMQKADYATLLDGYVDKALIASTAYDINGMDLAGANKYYGTDAEGNQGIYDIQKYVSTADGSSYMDLDQVTFVPIDGSVQSKHLENSLLNKINNNYHTIYNTGTLKSAEINSFNFGDNLTVTINGNTATISAKGVDGPNATNFANLADVDVVYSGNEGKALAINAEGTGIVVSDAPSLDAYMLKAVYTDPTDSSKVKRATLADVATNANTATNATKLSNKTVDDTKTTNAVLWTASKIISNTSAQIKNEGVTTYSGTTEPDNSVGKDGDIYALIEA
mgnify:CR=1 FL=1